MTYLGILALVSLLILIHELGHLVAAKLVGIPIDGFSVGFGPKLWTRRYGQVDYSLRALPLGGFVAPAPDEWELCPLHKRVAFFLGGPWRTSCQPAGASYLAGIDRAGGTDDLYERARCDAPLAAVVTAAWPSAPRWLFLCVQSQPPRFSEAESIDALSDGANRMSLKNLIAVAILTQGCATLHNGRHQEIEVVTDPAGATVEVRCGKPQPAAVTPTTIRLPRRVEQCSLILARPGFQSETVVFDSSPSGWVWGNFAAPIAGAASGTARQSDQAFGDFFLGALLGGAGFGVDALSGAMWQLEPVKVERKLVPK